MEPNESHYQQQQLRQQLPYYHHQHQPTTTSTGNTVPTSNNGLFQPQTNDGSSSVAVYPHSVPSSAITAPIEPIKRKRGRPRKYVTPEQALAAKKIASSASSSSAKERREQSGLNSGSLKTCVGKTGQCFTPHIINIASGEDVAQKIMIFAQQSKHELCVLSASGTISNASLRQPASPGGNVSYEGQYQILSLSGSYIRTEQGRKEGGLSVSLSGTDRQIIGGAIGTHLIASGPVQVILGTFQFDRKKETDSGGKGEASRLTSPVSTGPMIGMGYRPMRGNDEQQQYHQQFLMQGPGMHMTHSRPPEWDRGGNSGYGDYDQQTPD